MKGNYYSLILVLVLLCAFFGFLTAQTNILPNGDLETYEPGFWTRVNDGLGGAACTWADDASAGTGLRSLKVEKASATTDVVGWKSDNNASLYWNDAKDGAYAMHFSALTSGVNTNPATDDASIGVKFSFYAGGNLIGEKFVTVDQSVADKDWTNYEDALLLAEAPEEVYAEAIMGKDASGTVWFDNIDCNTTAEWSMGMFNGDAETPVGWLYWADGANGFAALVSDTVHDGDYGVLLYEKDEADDEMVFYSIPNPATAGNWYKFSVWVKTDSINTDTLFYPTNVMMDRDNDRMGITFIWHTTADPDIWQETAGDHFFYIDQREASSGWTQYSVVAQAPEEAGGIAMRARFTSFPTGYAWFDDFEITEAVPVTVGIDGEGSSVTYLSSNYQLMQNYPNPFNPETIIEYRVPKRGRVELNIYNMLGQKIRTLVNDDMPAGTYQVFWNGRDDSGNMVATGIYLYQLRGQNASITKKLMFLK
jgi:hypothetical protein